MPHQSKDKTTKGKGPVYSESERREMNKLLDKYNYLQEQTMTENLEMQKAQAFWNPLEAMSKKDATS